MPFSEPLFKSLKERICFFEIVRHPLYMIIQQTLNMERILGDPRDINLEIKYKDYSLPYFAYGWEELFVKSNSVDKVIYTIDFFNKKRKLC